MNQRELKASIKNDPNLTDGEKSKRLHELSAPYRKLSDDELLQLVRDFVEENNRMPERRDLVYDTVLKERFGPWGQDARKGRRERSRQNLSGTQTPEKGKARTA